MPIDEVREWFKATDKKSLQEYKFFKRDVLKPAVEQINDISDIFVTIEEQREKRGVVAAILERAFQPKVCAQVLACRTGNAESVRRPDERIRSDYPRYRRNHG